MKREVTVYVKPTFRELKEEILSKPFIDKLAFLTCLLEGITEEEVGVDDNGYVGQFVERVKKTPIVRLLRE